MDDNHVYPGFFFPMVQRLPQAEGNRVLSSSGRGFACPQHVYVASDLSSHEILQEEWFRTRAN